MMMSRQRHFATAVAITLAAGIGAQAQTVVLQDFEGAFTATPTQPNTSFASGTSVDGSTSLDITVNNGANPFFGQILVDVLDVPIADFNAIQFDAEFIGGSGENLIVQLIGAGLPAPGSPPNNAMIGRTQDLSGTITVPFGPVLAGSGGTIEQVQFNFGGADFGTTNIGIDNIVAVPEPGMLSLVGFAALALVGARRR